MDGEAPCKRAEAAEHSPAETPETVITVGSVSFDSTECRDGGGDGSLNVTLAASSPEQGKPSVEPKKCEDEAAAVVLPETAKGESVVIDIKCGSVKGSGGHGDEEYENVCRICHLGQDQRQLEGLDLIQIGCMCKDELGTAHRHCAEAWFKVKGNRCCEICGACAKNVIGIEDANFMEEWYGTGTVVSTGNGSSSERERCWKGQPFCNFLMACLVVAFILPWFFRVNMF